MNCRTGCSPPRGGGVAAPSIKMLRSLLMKAQTGWSVPDNVTTSTFTIMTTPSAPLRRLRAFFILAQPPLLFQERGTPCPCNSFTPSMTAATVGFTSLKHVLQSELNDAWIAIGQTTGAADVALNFSEGALVYCRDGKPGIQVVRKVERFAT